jgi:4-hydroxysphinganine ceramide fatty acyl 2-hydroxylase
VDWNKPMVSQIPALKKNYTEWVNKPVDRPLRLFEQTWLEVLSKTPWWVVPTFWLPIIYLLIWFGGANKLNSKAISLVNYSVTY